MAKFVNSVKDTWIKTADWVVAHPHATLAALIGSALSRLVF